MSVAEPFRTAAQRQLRICSRCSLTVQKQGNLEALQRCMDLNMTGLIP